MKIALFPSTPLFEDFYARNGISKGEYVRTYHNEWSFDYVNLLNSFGVHTCIYFLSGQVDRPEVHTHGVTGCTIKFFPKPLALHLNKPLKGHHLLSSYLYTLSPAIFLDLKRNRPNLIYVQEYETGRFDVLVFFGQALSIPVLGQSHGTPRNPGPSRAAKLRKMALRRAAKLLCITSEERQRVCTVYDSCISAKLEIVRNPVDPAVFFPMDQAAAKAQLGLQADRRFILFVGRLANDPKGVIYLLEAFSKVVAETPDTVLLLAGRGPDEELLRAYVETQSLHDSVRFLGWVGDKGTLRCYLNACELLVMPSLYEGLPIVITEAMACGRAVVATDVNGIPDQITDGVNGVLVPPRDSDELAKAIRYLLDNPDVCERMGAASREIFEREFSAEVVGPKLYAILNDAARRG